MNKVLWFAILLLMFRIILTEFYPKKQDHTFIQKTLTVNNIDIIVQYYDSANVYIKIPNDKNLVPPNYSIQIDTLE